MTFFRCVVLAGSIALVACGDDEIATSKDTFEVLDTSVATDTFVADIPDTLVPDTGRPDTLVPDTLVQDTFVADTVVQDTVVADTIVQDTVVADTVVQDTVVQDTVVQDTVVADTVVQDTVVADTTPQDTGPQACPPSASETVVTRSTVFTNQSFAGTSNVVQFESDMCSDPPDSNERTYRFDLTSATEIYAETDCGWDCELVLTKDGCDDNNVIDCAATIGEEIYAGTLAAGTYRFFIEGDDPEDPDAYDFMLNFNHTAGQAQCTATSINAQNPANCDDPIIGAPRYELLLENQNLALSDQDDFFLQDVGSCSKDDSHVGGAPDKVYSFTLNGTRDVDITLMPDGWDGMLAVTGPGGPCGAVSKVVDCSDDLVGSDEELSLELGAGTWYIIVDGFGEETFSGGANGAFDLEVLVFDDACND
ncbi:MAG: hypothetical protein IT385_01990 [Deltaproteobacteria bacterium]|nr:hypothetical protein [Deltaproteobacteria bacterium]